MKRASEECEYCKEKDKRVKNYEEEIEKEKIVQCQMALERERIAKGMQCTKADELQLKEMQMMQMQEKKLIEEEAERVEKMWQEVMLNTVRMKETYERQEADRLKQEMVERRMFYDQQILSANKKKKEAIKHDREVENRRLEKLKKKMEEDYYEEIRRKKDQQRKNRLNCIKGHEMKLSRIRNEKNQARELDNETIRIAETELNKERQHMKNQIQALRIEKQVFVDNYNKERIMNDRLAQETDDLLKEWEHRQQQEMEEKIRSAEVQKLHKKKNAAQEYKSYIEHRSQEMERERRERYERMERVKNTAFAELQRNLAGANDELRRQIEYRATLTKQIKDNQKIMEEELNSIESKQRPFTKKANMFKDAMADKVNDSRISTNPVHPFRRILQSQSTAMDSKFTLPTI